MGLNPKPTSHQLMIGDFMREKKKKQLTYGNMGDLRDRNNSGLKSNTSEGNILSNKQGVLDENYQIKALHRRHTSKSGEREERKKILNINKRKIKEKCLKGIKIDQGKKRILSTIKGNKGNKGINLIFSPKIKLYQKESRASMQIVSRDKNMSQGRMISKIGNSCGDGKEYLLSLKGKMNSTAKSNMYSSGKKMKELDRNKGNYYRQKSIMMKRAGSRNKYNA